MIEVDIATKILPSDHEVFFARPGNSYRLYSDLVPESVVAPDLPALGLKKNTSISKQTALNARIRRSRRIRNWHMKGRDQEKEPERKLSEYDDNTTDGTIAQLRAVLFGYFEKAKKGDLVLVTPQAFSQNALIGEFVDEPHDFVAVKVPRYYEDDELTARRVRWLAQVQKRSLSQQVLDIVSKPNAFVALPRSSREEMYRLAYTSFSTTGGFVSRFDVREHRFNSFDDLLLQAFFNFVATNTQAVAEGKLKNIVGISDAIFSDPGKYTPELEIAISSPGFLRLTSLYITPLVAAVLLALAVEVGPEAADAAKNGTLRIGNTMAAEDDPCVLDVQRSVIHQLKVLRLDNRWAKACEKARQAAQNTGVKGSVRVRR